MNILKGINCYQRFRDIGLLVIFMLCPLFSSATPSIEDYGALPTVSMTVMSPDGKFIAFRKVAEEKDLLLVYSVEEKKIIHATDISEIAPRKMYFISDYELILVMSDYRKISGYRGAHNISTASRLNLKSGDFSQLLTPGYKIYKGQTGLGRIVGLSPDKKFIYMPAFVGQSETDQSPEFSLVRVDLNKPKSLKVVERGDEDTVDYFINAKGDIAAQEVYDNRRNKYQILVPEGKRWKAIYEVESELIPFSVVGITADGKSLVILDEGEASDRTGYFLMSLADGSFSATDLSRPDKDVESVITDLNRVVHGVRYSGFTPSYKMFDPQVDTFIQNLLSKFPEHSVWLSSWTSDWKNALVLVEGSSVPGDYYTFNGDTQQLKFLTSSRPRISESDLNPIGKMSYQAEDGLRIPTLLTIPKDKLSSIKNMPTVVMPHGGPESYNRIGFSWLAQMFASRGYLVVQPQFRGSDGFGGDHIRAGYGEWGKKMQSDITDGVNFLVKKGMVDPGKVCIVGWSYGGYAALAGGAFTPDLYQCVVSINGVSDLPRMLKSEKSDHGKDHWVVSYWEKAMADGKADKDTLREVSPVFHADAFKAPVLLVHGKRDKIVPIKQSEVMRSRLKKAGHPVELVTFKKGDHSLMDGEERVRAAKAVAEFVDSHLQ